MKTLVLLIAVIVLAPYSVAQQWHLEWSDEFSYKGLPDTSKWSYEVGYIRNNEKQYYTKDDLSNARVENGMLVIEAHKKKFKEFDYTSASINTLGKSHFRYGRIEVRAKLPTGVGTWPAIWMMGINRAQVGWPTCGEIDIMENVGFDPNVIHGNVHTAAYNHVKKTNKGNEIIVAPPFENFIIYAVEWSESKIDFFVEDKKYFTFENENTGNETWPFDKDFYLLINLAIGGAWGGREGIDESIFPQKYLVDYVRVYKKIK